MSTIVTKAVGYPGLLVALFVACGEPDHSSSPTDAGSADGVSSDSASSDVSLRDVGQQERTIPADVSMPDSSGADLQSPDQRMDDAASWPDAFRSDAVQEDAGAGDISQTDREQGDARQTDASQPESAIPDSQRLDIAAPDLVPVDADLADADTTVADVTVADTAVADASLPDTPPDAGLADSAQPDSGLPAPSRLLCRQGAGFNWQVRSTPCLVAPSCDDVVAVGSWQPVACAAQEHGCQPSVPSCGDSLCEEGEDEVSCARDCLVTAAPYNYSVDRPDIYGALSVVQGNGVTLERTYMYNLPACYRENVPISVIIALHGGGGTAEAMEAQLALNAMSEDGCFLAVYPNGISSTGTPGRSQRWNCGPREADWYDAIDHVDDVEFISELIDLLAQQYNINSNSVYATGLSNGACMAYRLACQLSDRISAIAPIGGGLANIACLPARPVSVMHFHGSNDLFWPYNGGHGCAYQLGVRDDFTPIPQVIQTFKDFSGCVDRAVQLQHNGEVSCETFAQCEQHTEVTLCTAQNGGHTVPGGYAFPSEKLLGVGKVSGDLSAATAMWEFFDRRDRAYDLYQEGDLGCQDGGWNKRVVHVDGLPRKTLWRAPDGPWTQGAIIALHGGSGTASNFCYNSHLGLAAWLLNRPMELFSEAALDQGFAVFALDSTAWLPTDAQGKTCGKRWDCLAQQQRDYLDLTYIDQVITELIPSLRPDGSETGVFMTGISNGGFTTLLASTHMDDRVTAFAPVSAGDPYGIHFDCTMYPGDRYVGPGRFVDSETGLDINVPGACDSDSYPSELPWVTTGPAQMPAFMQFHHEGDAACDISCMYKARHFLLQQGYVDHGIFVIADSGARGIGKHFWQRDYNTPMLDFFASF